MSNFLSRNKLLVFSMVILLFAIGVFLYQLNSYNTSVNYFGNTLLGNGFWLHPQNKVVKAVKKYETYQGNLVAATRGNTPGYFSVSLEPYGNSRSDEKFTFLMPSRADLANTIRIDNPNMGLVQQLGDNLIDTLEPGDNIEIDLQSEWNSDNYQEVVKLIVRKKE